MTVIMCFLVLCVTASEPEVLWSAVTSGGVYCSVPMGDLNADGVPDLCCGVNFWDSDPTVWAVSGKDGAAIWTSSSHKGIYQNEGFTGVPDMNGDDLGDLLLATPGGYDPPGRCIYMVSGADGSTIWEWSASQVMPVQTGWGYSCVLMDDMNGDGVAECSGGFGTSGSSGTGLTVCIDGASGDSLWTKWMDDAVEDLELYADVNDDGFGDLLAAVGGNSYSSEPAVLLSGSDGSMLWERDPGGDCMSIAILQRSDTFPLSVFCTFSGTAACYDGGGDLQWDYTGSGYFMDVRGGPDVNGDGIGDVALAADNGGAVCLSGADGQVLWSVASGANTWSVCWVDPVIIDEEPVPCVAAGSVNGRKVVLVNAVSGETVWEMEFTERVYNVSSAILDLPSAVVIAGLQDQQPLPTHAWALAGSMETGIGGVESACGMFTAVNPSMGSIRFVPQGSGSLEIGVFDLSGRMVYTDTVVPDGAVHSIPSISPGVYFVRVTGDFPEEVHRVTVI